MTPKYICVVCHRRFRTDAGAQRHQACGLVRRIKSAIPEPRHIPPMPAYPNPKGQETPSRELVTEGAS